MFVGFCEDAEHPAVHEPLEVAMVVVRWGGPDYEDIINGTGLQPNGLLRCTGAAG